MRCAVCDLLRRWLFEPLCWQLLFNQDMSYEIDWLLSENERLVLENEQLRAQLGREG